MSWLTQNKFLAGLIGVTAVGGLGLGYVIVNNGSTLSDLKIQLSDKKGELQSVENGKAFPNAENKTAIEANAKDYAATLEDLQDKMLVYTASEEPAVTVSEFQSLQNAYVDKLREMFSDVSTTENCRFGFDQYASKMAPQRATKVLSYHLEALEVMFDELSKVGPSAILNVYRPLSKAEGLEKADKEMTPQEKRLAQRRGSGGKPVYSSLTVELGIKLKEKSLTEFLQRLANHEDYCFVVRSLRISNERETSPNESELNFESGESFDSGGSGGGGGSSFFDFESEDAESSESEASTNSEDDSASSVRILEQILGLESVNAHLKIDILMFNSKEETSLPTLN